MELRDYQKEAIAKTYDCIKQGVKKPLIVAPTGAGKSAILGKITSDVASKRKRVCIVTHRAELVEQDAEAVKTFSPHITVGIFAASLNKKETKAECTVAMVQSIVNSVHLFETAFDVVIIDECHLVPTDDDTRYKKFLDACTQRNKNLITIGLTATPYRLDSGYLHKGKDAFFDKISFEIKVLDLLDKGFLSPIVSKSGVKTIDLNGVKKIAGDYQKSEIALRASDPELLEPAIEEITTYGKERNSILIFSPSVNHAKDVLDALQAYEEFKAEILTGDTPKEQRKNIVEKFRRKELKVLINCQVLTTGFDAPNTDMIVLFTATKSTALYVQMVGRGARIADGKENCLLLDYGSNVLSHGCFDAVKPIVKEKGSGNGEAPTKMCDSCFSLVHAASAECPDCGHVFEDMGRKEHESTAYSGAVLTTQYQVEQYNIKSIKYSLHKKKDKPDSVKVTYDCSDSFFRQFDIYEWLCPEHGGAATKIYKKTMQNELKIQDPPDNAKDLLQMLKEDNKNIKRPRKIIAKFDGSFYSVTKRIYI